MEQKGNGRKDAIGGEGTHGQGKAEGSCSSVAEGRMGGVTSTTRATLKQRQPTLHTGLAQCEHVREDGIVQSERIVKRGFAERPRPAMGGGTGVVRAVPCGEEVARSEGLSA
ncbi:hypothetical protein TRVL_08779 [Trypanosoma vivax]|nr:hypothetical protein TRVL_08779 [Trypanosoma vivax]